MECEQIANYIMDYALSHSTGGRCSVYFDDVNYLFGVDLPNDEDLTENIVDCLDYDLVIDCWVEDDGFSLNLYGDWDE